MADGSSKPIKDIAIGDEVTATDPETGRTEGHAVTHVHVNEDRLLADVEIVAEDGVSETLHTTQNHPFWDDTIEEWVPAKDLMAGHRLLLYQRPQKEDDGTRPKIVVVGAVQVYGGIETMWDLTVADLHTYYVVAGTMPVLVHNCTDVALGYRHAGTTGWATRNGWTHFNDLPDPDWMGPVQAAIESRDVTLHVNMAGFDTGFETMVRNGLGRNQDLLGRRPHGTELEMAWIARAVVTGKRDWASVRFYDRSGRWTKVPEPDWKSMDLPVWWSGDEK